MKEVWVNTIGREEIHQALIEHNKMFKKFGFVPPVDLWFWVVQVEENARFGAGPYLVIKPGVSVTGETISVRISNAGLNQYERITFDGAGKDDGHKNIQ